MSPVRLAQWLRLSAPCTAVSARVPAATHGHSEGALSPGFCRRFLGSVTNFRKQDSCDSHVLDLPIPGLRILPPNGRSATAPCFRLLDRGEQSPIFGASICRWSL